LKPQTQDLRLDQIRPRTYRQTKTNDCIRQKTPDKRPDFQQDFRHYKTEGET